MPENGNPVPQLLLRVAHPQKKRNFWVPKKNAIFGSQGGKDCAPIDLPTNRVKWRTAS